MDIAGKIISWHSYQKRQDDQIRLTHLDSILGFLSDYFFAMLKRMLEGFDEV